MARIKKDTKNNKVINSLMVISEAFSEVHILQDNVLETFATIDFIHYFEGVEDPRDPDRITYRLENILLLAFLVILSRGVNSFYAIASYVRLDKERYIRHGLIEDDQCPSHDTFRRVFELLDSQAIFEHTISRLYEFLYMLESEITGQTSYKQIMIDGKEVRGSGRSKDSKNPKRNTQILNVYDSNLKTCIHSEAIDEKTNEIPVAQSYLSRMNLKNVVVTADSLHCQKKTAAIISQKKGIYVLAVKENQPLLLKEINDRMDKYKSEVLMLAREKRDFEILNLPKGYAVDGFTGMKTFVRMKSVAHSKKKPTTLCFISNSSDSLLICEGIEKRWEIENGFHKEKDSVLNEDLFRSTYKNTVLNMAVLNNLAIQLVQVFYAISGLNYHDAKIYIQLHPVECMQKISTLMNNDEVIEKIKSELRKIKKLKLN